MKHFRRAWDAHVMKTAFKALKDAPMPNLAILVGNVEYRTQSRLACCHDDVVAMKQLLEETGKFAEIDSIEDASADELKTRIREALRKVPSPGELFFYFTGHGFQQDGTFFFCATDFEPKIPNQTGLSSQALYDLLRTSNAELVVTVIDACQSGSLLIKDSTPLTLQFKQGLTNFIQIASCLGSQETLTGDPISYFTKKFRDAALRKEDGTVYYSDIVDFLRDEFLNHPTQNSALYLSVDRTRVLRGRCEAACCTQNASPPGRSAA